MKVYIVLGLFNLSLSFLNEQFKMKSLDYVHDDIYMFKKWIPSAQQF
jgi:hypothetical protein